MPEPILDVRNLSVALPDDAGWRTIVSSVSFDVGQEIVALVGGSGSGKSLTARAIMGLLPARARPTADRLTCGGDDLRTLTEREWTRRRGKLLALMPQDPKMSLNPGQRIGVQIEETLLLHTSLRKEERREAALDMLVRLGLADAERIHRSYPRQLSGGMAQRAMMAAMLVNRPRLLIADEPTSALDREVQTQILALLRSLTVDLGMGLLLISHDLVQVARFADRVIVMRQGRIEEELAAHELADARSAYTRGLWAARPSAKTYGGRLPTADEAL
ncbi:ABC transporter ATP-binding protein [Aureimonas endophytica]|uniref:ABC transporter ATP-binding protein n=1 Tax=Aureimonas endophytica TaxID=2027858 RepID=A0A916ZLE9_9HYPH|nr:ABC transporter ATP-binding protein [Aureimonas endophytica]GGE03263.1 ABC transporter ATP-binding protein [Aureimonas endophytica]